ncbi:hypothetical protein BDN70DRAFT_899211 [Pholiota conissans]|uniref:Uncharacterized protein n=1 Tax=Pholiota conissans TaxID=109636 RepID=A0A9P6CW22_9AGAR|nr:hypothetical protein BDN70DRAFT_899211 [Pholiota conissans]
MHRYTTLDRDSSQNTLLQPNYNAQSPQETIAFIYYANLKNMSVVKGDKIECSLTVVACACSTSMLHGYGSNVGSDAVRIDSKGNNFNGRRDGIALRPTFLNSDGQWFQLP